MERVNIDNLMGRAVAGRKFLNDAEKRWEGIKIFKRKALGICGRQSVKTLDEMAKLLYDTKIASSIEEGKELTPKIVGGRARYGFLKDIAFDDNIDEAGDKRYKISICPHIFDLGY